MFTINIYLRLALIAAGIIGGIGLIIAFGFWYGFPFLLAGIILLVGYLLLGTVQSAAQLMQNMDFLGAEKRLGLTVSPRLLYSGNRAYFYMLKGSIAMQLKQNEAAEGHLLRAKEIGLPTDNEKAMVYLQLANLAAVKQNWTGAKNLFREAKQCKISEPQLKEQVKEFEKALKQQGAAKAASHRHRGSMMAPGGKRRRPRAR